MSSPTTAPQTPKTALVLPGGGATGIVQVGMLLAWIESKLEHDMLFGSSVGALNGTLYHQGTPIDQIIDFWVNSSNAKVRFLAPWLWLTPSACFYDDRALQRSVREMIDPEALRANPVPFVVNTTNLDNWRRAPFTLSEVPDDETLIRVVLASASPPPVFAPVTIGFSKYGDGGSTNNYCILQAVEAGATRIVVLASQVAEPVRFRTVADGINTAAAIQTCAQLETDLAWVQNRCPEVEVIVVRPSRPTRIPLFNFSKPKKKSKRQDWIKDGYEQGRLALSGLAD